MLIRVLRYKGRAPDASTEARFGPAGGTIGRSPQCTLSLPDPERHISRIQAEINAYGAQFNLTDRGSAGHMELNGEPLQPGRPVNLKDGDELQAGDYVLRVELALATAPAGVPELDPFADLLPQAAPAPLTSGAPSGHPLAPPGGALIPDDFDPFSGTAAARAKGAPGFPAPHGRSSRAAVAPQDSIDHLFDLGEESGDPLAIGLPPGAGLIPPNTSNADDPFASLQRQADPGSAPMPDHAPEIHSPMRLPEAQIPPTAFLSWETPGGSSSALAAGKASSPEDRTRINPAVAPAHPQAPPQARDDSDALVSAFLEGAGLRELPQSAMDHSRGPRRLDPDTLQRIGALLQLFTQGVIDLLASRATVKSEMRSEVTMIQPEGNNPLKFSPDAAVALATLLARETPRGFMTAEMAVKDAMDDMVAHQVGVVAGMRAALQGLLARFEPAELEKRLSGRSLLQTVLPGSRKARLWEQFEAAYKEVSKEAEEDFETLFAREFVRAYEAQIQAIAARDGLHPKSKR